MGFTWPPRDEEEDRPLGGFGGIQITPADKKHVPLGRKILNAVYGPGADKMATGDMVMGALQALGHGFRTFSNAHWGDGQIRGPSALGALRAYTADFEQKQPQRDWQVYKEQLLNDPNTTPWLKTQILSRDANTAVPLVNPMEHLAVREAWDTARAREARDAKAPTSRTITRGGSKVSQEWNPDSREWEDVSSGPRWKPGTDREGDKPLVRAKRLADLKAKVRENVLAEKGIVERNGMLFSLNADRPQPQLSQDELRDLDSEVQRRLVLSLPEAPDSVIDSAQRDLEAKGYSPNDDEFGDILAEELVLRGYSP